MINYSAIQQIIDSPITDLEAVLKNETLGVITTLNKALKITWEQTKQLREKVLTESLPEDKEDEVIRVSNELSIALQLIEDRVALTEIYLNEMTQSSTQN